MEFERICGCCRKGKARFDPAKYPVEVYMAEGQSIEKAKKSGTRDIAIAKMFDPMGIKMVLIPKRKLKMLIQK